MGDLIDKCVRDDAYFAGWNAAARTYRGLPMRRWDADNVWRHEFLSMRSDRFKAVFGAEGKGLAFRWEVGRWFRRGFRARRRRLQLGASRVE